MNEENNLEIIDVLYESELEESPHQRELVVLDAIREEEMREEIYLEQQEIEQEETIERDTSFKIYNKEKIEEEKRQRKNLGTRVMQRIKRVATGAITLPVTILLGMALIGVTGGGFIAGVISLLVGIGIMVGAGFIMSAYSPIIGVLGLFIALGLLSGGGLVLCLMVVVTTWLKQLLRRIRRSTKHKVEEA